MTEKIVIYGSGGFAKGVAFLLEQINEVEHEWDLLGFIDDNLSNKGNIINGYPVLGDSNWFRLNSDISVVIGIGSPKIKKNLVDKLVEYPSLKYPTLIHPQVSVPSYTTFGQGVVICEGTVLRTNTVIKDFAMININCSIGHDVILDKYSTVLPSAVISGNVATGEMVDIGTNATIIQGLTIGEKTIIGAGAVVIKDLPANCTAVGSPAKPIKFHE